jgi:tRNA (mo5U34)-methyltransferase
MGLKLDIGCGSNPRDGYTAWDIKNGKDGNRLDLADGSAEAIYSSHVLEHFSHRDTAAVLKEWFRVLAPGGICQIAVPDFEWIASQMRGPWRTDLEMMIVGGQVDAHDHHKALFTESKLRRLMEGIGFTDVCKWKAMRRDCASMMCSLNLQGRKPDSAHKTVCDTMPQRNLAERVAAQHFWYHRIELPGGVVTPGFAPHRAESYRIPERLDGLTVLDIGAWDGYWSFEAVKRGAARVLAIDDFSDDVGIGVQHPRWTNFDLCREALGIPESVLERKQWSAYDIDQLGMFDVVFCFGVLYHLRHPLLVLDKIAEITRKTAYFESAILDYYSPYKGGLGHGYPDDERVMEFYPGNEYGKNKGNWWVPTLRCLGEMVHAAGFPNVCAWPLTVEPTALPHVRGFTIGSKNPISPEGKQA